MTLIKIDLSKQFGNNLRILLENYGVTKMFQKKCNSCTTFIVYIL